jgi:chitodextrinase
VQYTNSSCLRASYRRYVLSLCLVAAALALSSRVAQAETVKLSWDAPADGSAVSYLVERGTSTGVYTVAVPVVSGTSFESTGVVAGTRYFFVVRSVNARGERSAPSNEISIVAGATASAPFSTSGIVVATETALQAVLPRLVSNSVVSLAPGTYQLTRPLVISASLQDVTIRSSTGRASDVVILGPRATSALPVPPAIAVANVVRFTLADLTIRNTPGYAVLLGAGVQQPRLRRLHIVDNGHFLQSNLHPSGAGAAGGLVEGCTFEYVATATGLPSGLDIRGGRDWIVRLNRFVDPRPTAAVTFGPAVHAWLGSANTLVERNTFVNTTREIVFGLGNRSPNQHTGGFIRNNAIVRLAGTGVRGPAISVLDSPATTVVHNTALLAGTSRTAIEYAHPDTRDVRIANNLVDAAITPVDFATAILDHNVLTAVPSMFVAAARGDLRLVRASAAAAVDRGTFVPSAPIDLEGQPRPQGAAPDIGADEVPPQ